MSIDDLLAHYCHSSTLLPMQLHNNYNIMANNYNIMAYWLKGNDIMFKT